MKERKAKIVAVCIGERKGERKRRVESVRLREDYGIEGDAHAGRWHRQVSLLSSESINRMGNHAAGDFAENITTEGINLSSLSVGTRLIAGEALLEVTQIGKECHSKCAIYNQSGDCIMPREGIFTRVLKGGEVKPGDDVLVQDDASVSDRSLRWSLHNLSYILFLPSFSIFLFCLEKA